MERTANVLSGLLEEPVTDGTGLKGNYDIKFRALVAGHADGAGVADSELELFHVLREQLGLQLVRKSQVVDVLVIDHVEKTPTDN
jgi:uncharacterized protein (TIGR03435 family)